LCYPIEGRAQSTVQQHTVWIIIFHCPLPLQKADLKERKGIQVWVAMYQARLKQRLVHEQVPGLADIQDRIDCAPEFSLQLI
jgi:hypothetical protein